VTVSLADLGNPSSFDWFAATVEYWIDRIDKPNYNDHAPSTKYVTYFVRTHLPEFPLTVTAERTVNQGIVRTVVQPTFISNYLLYALLPIATLIGAFVMLARRKRIKTVELKRKPMEIKVFHRETNKFVRLEVRPENTIGSVVEAVVEALKLPRDETYVLLYEGKKFDQNEHSTMLSDAGIEDGDQLELQKRLKG
jgi:chloramphenicol O-acetyltransferase